MDEYRPQMSAERVQRLRRWHEEASEELHRLGAHDVEYLGLDLHVPEQVFPPTPTSDLLGNEVRHRVTPGDRVLDMGCGAGANAILAAQITDGVVAVDVNPLAVEATRPNAERNDVQKCVSAFQSDLFDRAEFALPRSEVIRGADGLVVHQTDLRPLLGATPCPDTCEAIVPFTSPIRRRRHRGSAEKPGLRATTVAMAAKMPHVKNVEVVLANNDRVTLRVGDVFLKIDADQTRTDVEVEAMAMAPVPTPDVLWRNPPALALAAVPGTALGRLGEPSTASPAAWAAAGTAIRTLHDAPPPPWPGKSLDELASRLERECDWLVANEVLPADVVNHNRHLAEAALRPWTPVFTHGDLHIEHVFIDGGEITGILDWSEACPGDALFDLATLTLGHDEHLDEFIVGYGADVDRDLIRAWRSWRCLTAIRWLFENGYGVPEEYPEVAVLRSNS